MIGKNPESLTHTKLNCIYIIDKAPRNTRSSIFHETLYYTLLKFLPNSQDILQGSYSLCRNRNTSR